MFGFISYKEHQKTIEKAFLLGIEEGTRKGMSFNFERSQELSETEYNEVIEFLTLRGLELCCYDVHKGGFRIRKRLI